MRFKFLRGISLLESLVAVTLLLFLIVIAGTAYRAFSFNRVNREKQLAYTLLIEQMEAWRTRPFDELANQAGGAFENILYHKGQISISDSIFHSGAYSVVNTAEGPLDIFSTLATPPIGPLVQDGTLEAYFYIPSGTPTPWDASLLFRSQDENNGYVLTLQNTGVSFDKYIDGAKTNLLTHIQSITEDNWHKLSLVASGNSFTINLEDVALAGSPVSDATYTKGSTGVGFATSNKVYIDDMSYVSALQTYAWNFDDAGNEIGKTPLGWVRGSIYDLTNAQGVVEITDEEEDETSPLKKVTTTLSWGPQLENSISTETYVAQTGITK